LLLEDGVLGAITSSPVAEQLSAAMARGIKVYALSGDIRARGLSAKLAINIQTTDYNGFVELSMEYRCVQSWY
jgi:tRNA 2-thiouridine synthesizing protein B